MVGGDAAGTSAALQARRLVPDLEIVVVERGQFTGYSPCGIPFLLSGRVRAAGDLVIRPAEELRSMRIDVRTGHEVVGLDLAARRAEIHNLTHGRSFQLGFDFLLLATGARPRRPQLPGFDLPHVHGVRTLDDATKLIEALGGQPTARVAVIGSSPAAVGLAEGLKRRGASVTVLEAGPEVLPQFDPDMAAPLARRMRESGITVEVGVTATAIGEGSLETSAGELRADLVVLGEGVVANSELGATAGLLTGSDGALVVDRRQRASIEGVWAAGDCCQSVHRVSGSPTYQALGPVAAKQGRVAGINLAGGYATFPGVLGTSITEVYELQIGRTGLSGREAEAAGFSALFASVESVTSERYLPGACPTTVKLVAEQGTGRLLGVQSVGGPGSAKRVDVVAAALAGGLSVDDLVDLDLGYSPGLATVWDPLQAAARLLAREIQP